ncbi:MAG: glycosyltransferase family 4 protein [Gemmatimonadaceae bacterium]|nr:glycosyltransferase family 4 protein [Gemmatimonadaceae bacterium]
MTMRVGVDASTLANGRGFGRFTRELLTAMLPTSTDVEWVLFADARASDAARDIAALATRARVVVVPQSVSPTVAAASDGSRSVSDMLRFTRAVHRERLDAFFSPAVYAYFPTPPGLPLLVCLHDAIAERFPELTLPSTRARLFWQIKSRLALAQSRLVLTVSETAAADIARFYRIAPSRIRVALEAPSAAYRPSDNQPAIRALAARHGVTDAAAWFIYVGGFNPHKHVDVLVSAHAKLVAETGRATHLLLVGALTDVFHESIDTIRQRITQVGTGPLVHWTGFVPDDELRLLLSGAVASVLASECEGFGLPAVEAAACGTPVIATLESPLPQLLPGAGHFVAPRDERALVEAMRKLLVDPVHRASCAQAALAGAQRLSWGRTAGVTWQAIQDLAA